MTKNLLFITADQWRGECLSCLGHKVQTPNLDKLAEKSLLFKQHYANAVPCGPSRASLHTGMYMQNHRASTNGTPLDARHSNWALELRKLGYDPVLFGYTDTANDPRQFDPDDPILKTYEGPLPGIRPYRLMGTDPTLWAAWLADKGYEIPDSRYQLYTKKLGPEYEDGADGPAPLAIPKEHHDTRFMVDEVIDFLSQDRTHDFCVHLSLLRPHPPWIAPEPYNNLYAPETLNDFTRADNRGSEANQHPWLAQLLKQKYYAAPADPKKLARLKASYFGLMTEVDDNLGRLFDYLEHKGLMQDTLIIFTSDHGEQMGDHWLLGKAGYFDQSYQIPLIIYDPSPAADTSRGKQVSGFTENIDIMPTILDWAGIEVPVQCDGKSLLPFLKSGTKPPYWREAAHFEFDFRDMQEALQLTSFHALTRHQCSLNVIRDDAFKYVHFTGLAPLFFDLKADPDELNNLAEDPDYTALMLNYAQKMLSWRMNHDEQTLTHLSLTDTGVISRPSPRY